jgi:glyoxalase family protein
MAATRPTVHGLHHVTSIAAAPQENLDFYVGVMGLRLVKRSVNQDAPGTYHLFYADEAGTPGTDLTFFPWPDMAPVREGSGQAREVQFGVPPGSAGWWRERLESRGFEADTPAPRFGESTLPLRDPHGHRIALVETEDERPWVPWEGATVPAERQLRGMHAVRMVVRELAPTRRVLEEVLGFEEVGEEDGWRRFGVEGGGSGRWLEIREEPDARLGRWGTGGVHHVAWQVEDDREQAALRERLVDAGLQVTPPIDRFWFRSVYFREPGGVLFELATMGPGFERDETRDALGESLILPPWLEPRRAAIESALPPLDVPATPGRAPRA